MTVTPPPLYTSIAQAAKALCCSPDHVRSLIERGVIPTIRLGRLIRVPLSALSYESLLKYGNLQPEDIKQ